MATTFQEIDPSSGEPLGTWPTHTPQAIDSALHTAAEAQRAWATRSFAERATVLYAVAARLEEGAGAYGELMAREMGKPVAQGRAEATKCAWVCRHYAENAEGYLAPTRVGSDATRSYVRTDPLGLVLAIMPWNFPFWQLFRFGAPALMAGNGVVLKHAPNVLGCGDAIAAAFTEAGLPEGLFAHLVLDEAQAAEVIADDRIRAVTLTGSGRAGSAVASQAGRHLKKTVLELGGSDPFIVLEDADVARAAEVASAARLLNSGQSCIAAKRFIVVEAVADAFEEAFAAHLRAATVGPPMTEGTDVGPIARDDLRAALHRQVTASVARGALLRFGGVLPPGPGFFYPVTLLTGVHPGMPAWDEEVFGPVAALRVVADAEAALEAANASRYGLGASIWTRDIERGEALARRIESGCVFVNGLVKSDPRLPFGGIKDSGYGRELGALGIREFVNEKTVWIA